MTQYPKIQCVHFIRKKISSNEKWALRGLLKTYEHQTDEEKNSAETINENGIGFSGVDANFLTGVVDFYNRNGFVTKKQMAIVFVKMKKYAGQLYSICDKEKLYKVMDKEEK